MYNLSFTFILLQTSTFPSNYWPKTIGGYFLGQYFVSPECHLLVKHAAHKGRLSLNV